MREVRIEGLGVTLGARRILEDISARVELPGVTALIGENGAGKTTLIHALLGLLPLQAGRADTGDLRVAYCPDTPEFEPFLSAPEVVQQSAHLASVAVSDEEISELLKLVGLLKGAEPRVGGFSRGMKQRLGIAAALILQPDLLILDEPMSALDPAGRQQILNLIAALGERMGVLFSSHILNDIEAVATQVQVLKEGRILYAGPVARLMERYAAPDEIVVEFEAHGQPLSRYFGPDNSGDEPARREQLKKVLSRDELPKILQLAIDSPAEFRAVRVAAPDLNQAYLRLMEEP